MVKLLTLVASLLFVLAVPFALAFSNFRWFVSDPANYVRGQEQQAVPATTGIPSVDLATIDLGLVRYFRSDRGSLATSLEVAGVKGSPFSERDAAHLEDVHDLISGVLRVQWLAGGYALLFLAGAVVAGAWRLALRCIAVGSALTVALFGLLGLLSLLDWDSLFLRFHLVSFSNDLWRLDPSRDALIRLYPPGFFLGATIQLVAMSVAEAAALVALSIAALRVGRGTLRRTA